jgi:hypothetical protein
LFISKNRYNELEEKERYFDTLSEANQKNMESCEKLYNKNKILIEENSKLKTDIKNQKAKNIKIESERYDLYLSYKELKRQIYNIDNDWHIFNNKAWLKDKKTGEILKIIVPKIIKEDKIEDFDFNEDFTMCTIRYEGKKYYIPPSLLEKKYNFNIINNKNKIFEPSKIESTDDVKKIIKNNGFNSEEGYWKSVIDFIIFNRGMIFTTKEFIDRAKIRNRESARIYINYLIDLKLIKKIRKGNYKILFNFE